MGENRSTDAPIRVLLADDHTMFRQGLAGILASHGAMEVQIPVERAKETLEAMRAFEDPPPKVVIVTMFESPRYVRELTGVGASSYLLKSDSAEHLVAAVRAAVLDPEGGNVVVGMPRAMLERAEGGADGVLTTRQLEVLLLAARGLSNGRIASSLYITEGTVKRHLADVYEQMGVGSRGEAMREALARDWITIEEIKEPTTSSRRVASVVPAGRPTQRTRTSENPLSPKFRV